jgi:hypothetical protein
MVQLLRESQLDWCTVEVIHVQVALDEARESIRHGPAPTNVGVVALEAGAGDERSIAVGVRGGHLKIGTLREKTVERKAEAISHYRLSDVSHVLQTTAI